MKQLILAALLAMTAACVPKIYVIDRQTVLDDEAAGEWPEFEKDLVAKAQKKTPTADVRARSSEKTRRNYRVLNGDMVSESK